MEARDDDGSKDATAGHTRLLVRSLTSAVGSPLTTRIAAEFHRITNISLKNKFYAELDKHTLQLLAVYRQKAARTGKAAEALRRIFSAYDRLAYSCTSRPPVYLREDDSLFFKMWNTEEVDEPDIADSAVALVSMVNGDSSSTVQFDPAGFAIALEDDKRKQIVRLKVTCKGKCALNDHSLQTAILNEISEKLKNMRLESDSKISWRKGEDGEVFHQENNHMVNLDNKCNRHL
ncbi:hypothetical protein G5714_002293 [Onychostoma macrolepis]|uniref:Uncharacterized protein n=1 Tax=Onychostoma macrolepis TaxID=369639 RepID=A0A7J6DER4_9TELE|nr:hypothetical protein G5714_002293 [Onychostoma macrolepis]